MDLFELLKAVVLGIIEGITEWLPISSTGHMILVDEFLQLKVTPAFKEMFLVVIQLGAILAVLVLYFHKLNPFSPSKSREEKRDTLSLWGKVIIANIPSALVGIPFNDKIDSIFYNYQTVAIALIVYGVLFIVIENRNRGRRPKISNLDCISYGTAFAIGLFQTLALIPGTSRSGSTILGAMLLGLSRPVAAEFSFFLSIPVMFGASAVKLLKFGFHFTSEELIILLTGMAVAFLVSMAAIRFLVRFVKKHSFKPFGWYRIILGALVLFYFLAVRA